MRNAGTHNSPGMRFWSLPLLLFHPEPHDRLDQLSYPGSVGPDTSVYSFAACARFFPSHTTTRRAGDTSTESLQLHSSLQSHNLLSFRRFPVYSIASVHRFLAQLGRHHDNTRTPLDVGPEMFARLWLCLAALVSPTLAIHASEAGVIDWHKSLIGPPLTASHRTAPSFYRTEDARSGSTSSVILSATASNVLAALRPDNGSVGK